MFCILYDLPHDQQDVKTSGLFDFIYFMFNGIKLEVFVSNGGYYLLKLLILPKLFFQKVIRFRMVTEIKLFQFFSGKITFIFLTQLIYLR